MGKYDEYTDYMTDEDKELARKDNQSLSRFVTGLLLTIPYGVIAFFDVWKLLDSLPLVLIELMPGIRDGNPSQLYTYITILCGGLVWFITFAILWSIMARPDVKLRKRLTTMLIWCAAAAAAYIILHIMIMLVI